ncbi:hypothetical protein GCM10009557_24640 [Virgisporangium ochraceum]|uniref:Uncharacterized protein n=1 Tax=Virgisporangium ochraceum TaxID=65505 RepID=A0A8J3ZT09_9ACTN|nr:hypothetical protein [Virgisporangium ochraceum]GIJ68452.1 hypothetical protein Voc01_033690 [Virgisporangium ochraceum]
MTVHEDRNAQSDLPEPADDAADVEVIAHSDEETEDPPNCYGIHIEK